MAQNDVIKEIVFIADEQYEAPAFAWGTALAYLLGLVVAEVMTAFISPLVGMILYGLILVALLVQSSIGTKKRIHNFLVILSIVPLMRLLAMTVPPARFDAIYWYLLVALLLSVAVFITARLAGLNGSSIGLRINKKDLPLQLLIGMTGLAIGLVEYLILRPKPLLLEFGSGMLLFTSLVLLIFAGLLQEIIFRGLLQTSSTQILDRFGILYVALVFALQYLVFRSLWTLLFVFLVGLAFGIAADRTRSLVGVSLSHGLANVSFFLIFPLLIAGTAAKVDPPLAAAVPASSTPTLDANVSPTRTNEPIETQSLVLIPATGPTVTPFLSVEEQVSCGLHPNWVVYVTQVGDTLVSISAKYSIDITELRNANCFEEDYQLSGPEGLFVPFDLILRSTPTLLFDLSLSPTPTLPFVFSSLNTPTVTPTKKPTRKPAITSTSTLVQEITPIPSLPTSTPAPPPATPEELPTEAPTQKPNPPPPPTPED
jgi:membrane protease YdiL (CAAX protease family)